MMVNAIEEAIAILCTLNISLDHLKKNFMSKCLKSTLILKKEKGFNIQFLNFFK